MKSPPPGHFIRFSTDGMSDRDAISYWREFLGEVVAKIDVTPVQREGFHQSNTFLILPDVKIAFCTTTGMVGRRTRSLIADGADDLMITIMLSGSSTVAQRGHELDLGYGQAALLSLGDVGSQVLPQTARFLNFAIPRNALHARVENVDDATMRLLRADNPALRLLTDYVALATGNHTPLDPGLHRPFASHVLDLVALTLGATRDGTALAQGRGVRAARLAAMKADIQAHLRQEGLSVHDVAKRHGITPRYVQLLFDSDGMTFTEFVLEQRLAQAHQMLANPLLSNWTISAIAYEVGFSNLSYFNRTFLKRFGATPSDVRGQAHR